LTIGDFRAVIRQSSFGTRQLVSLSVRFDPDHQLPDKAIDLVDKAGARTRVPVLSMMPGAKELAIDDWRLTISGP
jgi:ATP-dependent Clp protease ATP-binding subunit ClpA